MNLGSLSYHKALVIRPLLPVNVSSLQHRNTVHKHFEDSLILPGVFASTTSLARSLFLEVIPLARTTLSLNVFLPQFRKEAIGCGAVVTVPAMAVAVFLLPL